MKCSQHPDVETALSCNLCGKPICTKCLVQTPVGMKCRECARLRRLPMYHISPAYYARATGGGLAAALALGFIWPFISFGGFFFLIIAAGVGYGIGEAISFSVNRKRGPPLQAIAGVCMIVAYVLSTYFEAPGFFSFRDLLDVYGLIAVVIGVVVAVGRLR